MGRTFNDLFAAQRTRDERPKDWTRAPNGEELDYIHTDIPLIGKIVDVLHGRSSGRTVIRENGVGLRAPSTEEQAEIDTLQQSLAD